MESVFSQTYTNYEYIVINGGSEDGSKEVIEKHQNKFVYWVIEKDKAVMILDGIMHTGNEEWNKQLNRIIWEQESTY